VRVLAVVVGTLAVVALLCGVAVALENGDYTGTVKNAPGELSFDVDKIDGHKSVVGFTVSGVEYTCDVGSDGTSDGMVFDTIARVHHDGTFATKGEVFLLGSDPHGKLEGVIGHGKAHGTFKIKGELAGPSTDCATGLLGWKAQKNPIH
jgi:hypothetical protein